MDHALVEYTLCETAKLAGADPHASLLHALDAAIARPGAVTYPEDLLNARSGRPDQVQFPRPQESLDVSVTKRRRSVERLRALWS